MLAQASTSCLLNAPLEVTGKTDFNILLPETKISSNKNKSLLNLINKSVPTTPTPPVLRLTTTLKLEPGAVLIVLGENVKTALGEIEVTPFTNNLFLLKNTKPPASSIEKTVSTVTIIEFLLRYNLFILLNKNIRI